MLLWSASDHTRGLRREDFTLMSVTANWPTLHLQHTTNILLTQYIHPWILQLFLPRFHVPFPCHHTTGHWERFRELNPLPFHDLKPPILGQALPAPDILPLSPNNCLISCPPFCRPLGDQACVAGRAAPGPGCWLSVWSRRGHPRWSWGEECCQDHLVCVRGLSYLVVWYGRGRGHCYGYYYCYYC